MDKATYNSILEDFAKDSIGADHYPGDDHFFTLFNCSSCRGDTFRITIEHHSGSEEYDFKGIIWGECAACGYLMRLFTFTGEHRTYVKTERPECECGNRIFVCGMCERYEGESGIPGFFDEGVVVGKCLSCNRNKSLVFTD
jgi:hypothetical protein